MNQRSDLGLNDKRQSSSGGIVWWAAAIGACSSLLIFLGSPLFRVLGFEYASISALILSIACGFLAASRSAALKKKLSQNLLPSLILWIIPLALSTFSLVLIENCAFWNGLESYLLITLPTATLTTVFGSAFGTFALTRRRALIGFGSCWILSLIVSLLPGYLYPQLFTYGWQYGFFPGLIWDEYIQLGSAYYWHLVEWGALAFLFWIIATWSDRDEKWLAGLGSLLLLYVGLLLSRNENGVVTTHDDVEQELSSTIRDGNSIIHYAGASLNLEEVALLRNDVEWYVFDIRKRYELSDTANQVHIYIYPDAASLKSHVGTSNASIAKPWRSELHISKENLHSLKHELVHVMLREWGSFPVYASWSTGLTEGAAMVIDPSYDGMHTLHEHASAILRMKLAEGVQSVMSFSGFASGASTTSYVLAGSFSQFLLEKFSVSKFRAAYRSLDFSEAYGQTLSQLEASWKAHILPLSAQMDLYDSMRTEFYFQRKSILVQPCFRRLGELSHHASLALRSHRHAIADSLFGDIYAESGGLSALRGQLTSRLRRLDFEGAKSLLNLNDISGHPQRLSMYLSKGDLVSSAFYDTLTGVELSSGSMLAAFTRKHMNEKKQYLSQVYSSQSDLRLLPIDTSQTANANFVSRYLTAKAYDDAGMIVEAIRHYRHALTIPDSSAGVEAIRMLLTLRLMQLDSRYDPKIAQPGRAAWKQELEEIYRRRKVENHQPI